MVEHLYDTRVFIASNDDLSDVDREAVKQLIYNYLNKQLIVGSVIIKSSQRTTTEAIEDHMDQYRGGLR